MKSPEGSERRLEEREGEDYETVLLKGWATLLNLGSSCEIAVSGEKSLWTYVHVVVDRKLG